LAAMLCVVSPSAIGGELVLFDFEKDASVEGWEIEDDVVMGGVSRGQFEVDGDGHGVFRGSVSLENDGGFSSLQRYFDPIDVAGYDVARIRLKGDGKRYQFRVERGGEKHSYIKHFTTSGDWEVVEIPLSEMVPMFRGDQLDLPNYPGDTMNHIRFMIANGQAEDFELVVDRVWLAKKGE
jgi:NADH dehydrogenase [ubiquinone] 1 alpha subcomplex assembly factor 1